MRFVLTQRAGEHETFHPRAFARQIGEQIPLNLGPHWSTGTLLATQVSPDGRRIDFTIEVEDGSIIAGFIRDGWEPGVFGRGGEMPPPQPADSW